MLFRQSPGVSSTSEAFAARLGKMWQGHQKSEIAAGKFGPD